MSRCDGCRCRLRGDTGDWCPICGAPVLPDASSWEVATSAPGRSAPGRADAAVRPAGEVGAASPPDLEARPRRRHWGYAAWIVVAFALLGSIGTAVYFLPKAPAPAGTTETTITSSPLTQSDSPAEPRPLARPSADYPGAAELATTSNAASRFLTWDAVSGTYGYADETGAIVIEPQFDFAGQFVEGLAPVQVQGGSDSAGYGYIDTSGRVVIEPRFRRAFAFSEGLARVEVENNGLLQYGFIDRSGAVVVEPQYSAASDFSEGLAKVGLTDGSGLFGYGFIDRAGTLIIGPQFESARDFSEGLAAIRVDGKWGYIDRTGTVIIGPQFYYASSFMPSGFAAVDLEDLGRTYNAEEPPNESYPSLHQARIDKSGRVVSEQQGQAQ
jgi:WG containing repeat